MHDDFKDLIAILNDKGVKYLVIGGWAVSAHAEPRATRDMDILIKASKANAKAIFEALKAFEAPVARFKIADFTKEGPFYRFGQPPIAIDIITTIPGVDFESAWKNRVSIIIDDNTKLAGLFISRDDLIAAKKAAGRPQDLADVEALEKAKEADAEPKPLRATRKRKRKPRKPAV